ncbi:MAG: 23S rRNA (adenine(2030)-N(6))-methyltransferase RlmJ [Alphaproteobacteria bacterium]|nr:23S rRNA (adenine(2030)-N(6))-methyltransferase RlmJ [Alphaproteobacteria bacterium]
MNYRHAYHAGNFADCMKHALLVSPRRAMAAVLDTHAGIGRYDLSAIPAERTGEWRAGIGRLSGVSDPALADYLALVAQLGLYPGSPALIRALLRPQDRLACCELHPEDVRPLRRAFRDDPRVAVHHRDGFEAIGALLPPPERRGLVLIDPPYEAADEFVRVVEAIRLAHRRFPAGVVAAWYPVKSRAQVRGLHGDLRASGIGDVVAAELWLREPVDAARLNGCGLLVVNPPFGFGDAARGILAALLARLGSREPGETGGVEVVCDE